MFQWICNVLSTLWLVFCTLFMVAAAAGMIGGLFALFYIGSFFCPEGVDAAAQACRGTYLVNALWVVGILTGIGVLYFGVLYYIRKMFRGIKSVCKEMAS